MSTTYQRVEVFETHKYHRGYMALVWVNGDLLQVFSGVSPREVQADGELYLALFRKGLV